MKSLTIKEYVEWLQKVIDRLKPIEENYAQQIDYDFKLRDVLLDIEEIHRTMKEPYE